MTEKAISNVLKEISNKVPSDLVKAVATEEKSTPAVEMIVDKAIEDPNFPEEKKKQLQAMKNLGFFSKMTVRTNPKIEKKLDEYFNREINKAIKEGRLPPKNKVKDLPFIKKIRAKWKNKK